MSFEINTKLRKLNSWLLFFGIMNLVIISLIPWILVVENYSNNELYFNIIMMERSNNDQIKNFASFIFFIINLLWIFIIINSISYIVFSDFLFKKYPRFANIMSNISYINLIISTLIVYLNITLIKKVTQLDDIFLASVFSIIKFVYIPLLIGFLLLILSIISTSSVILSFIKNKELIKNNKKKINEQIIINASKKTVNEDFFKEKILPEFDFDIKKINSFEEKQKKYSDIESDLELLKTENFIKKKNIFKDEFEKENFFIKSINKINLGPFPPQQPKIRSKESSEIPISQEFEKALASVIEKRQNEIKINVAPENTLKTKQEEIKSTKIDAKTKNVEKLFNDKHKESKKEIKVRCPQCKTIFAFEKNEKTIKIKCPNCGKEGVIKYLNKNF